MIISPYVRLFSLLLGALVGIYIANIIVSRMARHLRSKLPAPQILTLGVIFFGNIPILWLAWDLALSAICRSPMDCACGVVYVLLAYNSLGFWYFNILNLSETSLHVHILMELLVEGRIRSSDLLKRYSAQEMIDTRIDRMIALGQLTERKGRYVVTGNATLLTVGKLIHYWRVILALPLRPQ